jgi:hypothetical protein
MQVPRNLRMFVDVKQDVLHGDVAAWELEFNVENGATVDFTNAIIRYTNFLLHLLFLIHTTPNATLGIKLFR